MDFLDFLVREWSVISSAPVSFVSGMIIVAITVFTLAKLFFSERIETLKEHLNHAKNEIEKLQNQKVVLADQQEKAIAELKGRVEATEERVNLSDVYQADLAELKAKIKALPKIYVGTTEPENAEDGDIWLKR